MADDLKKALQEAEDREKRLEEIRQRIRREINHAELKIGESYKELQRTIKTNFSQDIEVELRDLGEFKLVGDNSWIRRVDFKYKGNWIVTSFDNESGTEGGSWKSSSHGDYYDSSGSYTWTRENFFSVHAGGFALIQRNGRTNESCRIIQRYPSVASFMTALEPRLAEGIRALRRY